VIHTSLVLFSQSVCSDCDTVTELSHYRLNILEVNLPQASVFWLRTSIFLDCSHLPQI
jgi:hypothetical protein